MVCALVGLLYFLLYRLEEWRFEAVQTGQIQAGVADLDRLIKQFTTLPQLLSADPRLRDAAFSQDKGDLYVANQLLHNAAKTSDVAFAFLLNASGITIAARPRSRLQLVADANGA